MANLTLWEQIKELKSPKYKWVDLTHELSPETPIGSASSPCRRTCCSTMRRARLRT